MSAHSRRLGVLLGGLVMAAVVGTPPAQGADAPAGQAPQGRSEASPASERPPQTRTPQEYPPEQIVAGRAQFAAECGFCHGRDAAGGTGGTDLTRSMLVAEDVRGDRLGPAIRSGRPDQGMPAFALPDDDLAAIVAFIHDQKRRGDSAIGGRRSVEAADLQSGNAAAGKRYFEAACATCHAATGDLAGVATRFEGLALLQRMLYPRTAGRGSDPPTRTPQTVTVMLPDGEVVTGRLAYRDEFTIALTDAAGWYRSWSTAPTARVTFTIDDPLLAHVDQLGKYTDDDMHDVLAYLQTLR